MTEIQSPEPAIVVNPSPEPRLTDNKRRYLPLVAAALLLGGGGFGLGYMIGHKQGLTVVGFDADAQELSTIVTQQKKTIENMTLALNSATQERDVAVDNANDLSESLNKSRTAEAQAQALSNTFQDKLRERGGLSLSIQNLAIKPLPANAFEYVLDLVQVSPNKRHASGRVEIHLVQGDQVLSVPLQTSSYNFENYQRLTGRWTMPGGFNPQYIEVYLKGGNDAVVQRFAWQRGRDSIDSPATVGEVPPAESNTH